LKLGKGLFVAENMKEKETRAISLPGALSPGVFKDVCDAEEVGG
jgi:hypothetical protein